MSVNSESLCIMSLKPERARETRREKEQEGSGDNGCLHLLPLCFLFSLYPSVLARTCWTRSGTSLLGVPIFWHVCLTNTPFCLLQRTYTILPASQGVTAVLGDGQSPAVLNSCVCTSATLTYLTLPPSSLPSLALPPPPPSG